MPRETEAGATVEEGRPAPGKRRRRALFSRLRNYFLAGLAVTAPVGITLLLVYWVITWIDNQVVPLIPEIYNPQLYLEREYNVHIPGIGLVVVLVGLTLIGFLAAGLVGRAVVKLSEHLLNRTPVVRSIYGAIKQLFDTVLESSSRSFRDVVLVEYPRRGMWALGFITSSTIGEVQNITADEVLNVFLPTTPNPTSGFLLFVPRGDLVFLQMSVEDGIKMVVSGGIVTPPDRRPKELQTIKLIPPTAETAETRRAAVSPRAGS